MKAVKWLAVALLAALLAFPLLKPRLIVHAHRHVRFGLDPGVFENGWGLARRSQLTSPDWGPRLLGDPQVTMARLEALAQNDQHGGDNEALVQYRGEWALMFAALKLQGRSNAEILAAPHGLECTLGTLAAEADPPRWWAGADWLHRASKASPQGSFKLGLLAAADLTALVERSEKLGEHQLPCLVHCVMRHSDGFTLEQRTRVLKAWDAQQSHYFNGNNARSVARILEARGKLMEFLGPPGPLQIELVSPQGFTKAEQDICREVAADFLRSCGYEMIPGSAVKLEMGLQDVEFDQVATDYFVTYTQVERRQERSGQVRVGRYGVAPLYSTREVAVEHKERKSRTGAATIPSLVWQVQKNEQAVHFSLPPYGDLTQEQVGQIQQLLILNKLDESQQRDFDWYLRTYAGGTWRYGLRLYELDWNVEDRMR